MNAKSGSLEIHLVKANVHKRLMIAHAATAAVSERKREGIQFSDFSRAI